MGMTLKARRELIGALSVRYAVAGRALKGRILDELTATTGYGRKYAIALLRKPPPAAAPKARRRRRAIYPPSLGGTLATIWRAYGRPCSRRLTPFLAEGAAKLEACHHLHLSGEERSSLRRISASTVDRLLRPFRQAERPRGKSTTRPGHGLRQLIPISTFAERNVQQPGLLEIDLVAHCGERTAGDYVVTLNAVDLATGWCECIVPENRGQRAVLAALQKLRQRLPFPLRGIDSDNDGCFINDMLLRYCRQEKITFTRCRPYRKNDQAHVEERNRHIVRQVVGYDRYETEAVAALNKLWECHRLFANYFQPVMKLVRKTRIDGHLKKEYDEAKTPFRRLLDSPETGNKEQLCSTYDALDPVELQRQIEAHQWWIWHRCKVRSLADATTPTGYDN